MHYCLRTTTLHFNSPPSGNIRGLIKVEKRNNIPLNPTAITLNYAELWTCNSALRLRINVRLPPRRWYILNCLLLPLTVREIYNLPCSVITFLCFSLLLFIHFHNFQKMLFSLFLGAVEVPLISSNDSPLSLSIFKNHFVPRKIIDSQPDKCHNLLIFIFYK